MFVQASHRYITSLCSQVSDEPRATRHCLLAGMAMARHAWLEVLRTIALCALTVTAVGLNGPMPNPALWQLQRKWLKLRMLRFADIVQGSPTHRLAA